MSKNKPFSYYEFFAGGGMARAGLGERWRCLLANDFDQKKNQTYRINWPGAVIRPGDVRNLSTDDLPDRADLVWASFPCQDLSLAGGGAGLRGERSGTFWPFWELTRSLVRENRAPSIIVLENVCGALSSHQGKDFASICKALGDGGYRFGAVVIDASLFLPQSRPRLFIVAVRRNSRCPEHVVSGGPMKEWHTRALTSAYDRLSSKVRRDWIWWSLPEPKTRTMTLADIIEDEPEGVDWHTSGQTRELLGMMSAINVKKVEAAKQLKQRTVGAAYKRTRRDGDGRKVQRAEVRFDGVAGCLRTPAGGSSRQIVLVIDGNRVRSRLISARETARLMGLPDSYKLPPNYNEAYHLTGDGVVVPVVRHLAKYVLEPIVKFNQDASRVAA